MSRPADAAPRDAGFSLLEVVVAIGIFAVLVVAVLPQLLVGIASNESARRSTQAKSIALAELERMRNLPFHVAPSAGNYIDVFDRYFTDLTPPVTAPTCTGVDGFVAPATTTKGYVSPTGARCAWEPAGAFYRQVRSGAADPDLAGFAVVVNTQFLTDTSPPTVVVPPTGYDTQQVGRDVPAAAQVGITVTVLPLDRGVHRPLSTYTRISRHYQAVTRVRGTVDVTALDIGTATPAGVPLSLASGLVKLSGSLTSGARTDAVLSSVSAGLGTGEQGSGAARSSSAPPSGSAASLDVAGGQLDVSGCDLGCWGPTHLSSSTVSATSGLPNAGSPTSPLEATLNHGGAGSPALDVAAGSGASYRNALELVAPLVRVQEPAVGSGTAATCEVLTTGSEVRAGASGWLRTTSPTDGVAPSLVEACGTARTAPVALLPTSFAPEGVVRVQLVRASARCTVSGTAHTPATAYDFSALVQRWTPDGYVDVATVTPGSGADQLAQLDLATTPVGTHGVLGDWIESWSGASASTVRTVAAGGVASVTIPGVVNVVTQPLRNELDEEGEVVRDEEDRPVAEPGSTLSMSLGVLGCLAEDAR